MEPNSQKAQMPKELEEIIFAHLAQSTKCGVGSLRHGLQRLAEGWQKAVDAALQTFVHLDFCGHEARVTGGVV